MNFTTRIVLITLMITLSLSWSYAQEVKVENINLSGQWTGTSNWSTQNFVLKVDLKQEGTLLEGVVYIETLEKSKSATYLVNGYIKESTVSLKSTKFVEKTGAWCLPSLEFKFTQESNKNKLSGKWKSNNVKEGCWLGVSGRMDLVKKIDLNSRASQAVIAGATSIAESDREGNALSNELAKRNYYALIIASQDYTDESIIDLDQPINDATALRDELILDYTFKSENIIFLKNPTRTEIIETFDQLTKTVESKDNLLVFYAGHGIWDEQIEQGYWLPSDARKSSKAAWLSNGTIRDYIRAIDSKHTLLITDACFGGGILKTREAFQSSKAMLEMYKLPSRKAISSGALKTVPDKSVFIEYLIKALKNNNQPLLSADQLYSSFKYNVINKSPTGQVPQYGVISQADDEGGDFIFLKK